MGYVIVDDVWQQIEFLSKQPGPSPKYSDSELIAMVPIGEALRRSEIILDTNCIS